MIRKQRWTFQTATALSLLTTAFLSGCQGGGASAANASPQDKTPQTTQEAGEDGLTAYREIPLEGAPNTRVLVFAGDAAAYDGPESIADIARDTGLTPELVSSSELDAMSIDDLAEYGAIFWPGGYAGQQSSSLDPETRDRIRRAVTERGVSYVGFCAGAFIAASPATKPGAKGPAYGFSILPTSDLLDYYHLEDEGTPSAMVQVNLAGGASRQFVWWGGPKLPEIPGGVLGRHADDNTPAVIQAAAGKGLVILAGPHPEAPLVWRDRLNLDDTDGAEGDWAEAKKYFDAAVNHKKLPAM